MNLASFKSLISYLKLLYSCILWYLAFNRFEMFALNGQLINQINASGYVKAQLQCILFLFLFSISQIGL